MNFNTCKNENEILSRQVGEMDKRIFTLELDRREHLGKIDCLNSDVETLRLKNSQMEVD